MIDILALVTGGLFSEGGSSVVVHDSLGGALGGIPDPAFIMTPAPMVSASESVPVVATGELRPTVLSEPLVPHVTISKLRG